MKNNDMENNEQVVIVCGLILQDGTVVDEENISEQSPTAIVCGLILQDGTTVYGDNSPLSEYTFV